MFTKIKEYFQKRRLRAHLKRQLKDMKKEMEKIDKFLLANIEKVFEEEHDIEAKKIIVSPPREGRGSIH